MMAPETTIAYRYAQAFLNVYGERFNSDDLVQLYDNVQYFKNPTLKALLKVPRISNEQKKEALSIILQGNQSLKKAYERLIDLLIKDRRAYYIGEILQALYELYLKKNAVERFVIKSSSPLTSEQKNYLKNFLAQETRCTIMDTYSIDPNLIAGIRMHSNHWLWEYSIAKQLRAISRQLAL